MNDHTEHERTARSYTRKEVIRGAVGAGATLSLAPLIAACGGGSSSSAGSAAAGSTITIGSFSDPAMVPFRDIYLKKFTAETGIKTK